jgi:hypothetical protein
VSRYLQVAVEAIIPINASSSRDLGVRAQAHLYLPAILPISIASGDIRWGHLKEKRAPSR